MFSELVAASVAESIFLMEVDIIGLDKKCDHVNQDFKQYLRSQRNSCGTWAIALIRATRSDACLQSRLCLTNGQSRLAASFGSRVSEADDGTIAPPCSAE